MYGDHLNVSRSESTIDVYGTTIKKTSDIVSSDEECNAPVVVQQRQVLSVRPS